MSNTRRAKAPVRIATAFAATALFTAVGAGSAFAAGPLDSVTGSLPAVGSVTETVTGITGSLPIVNEVLGGGVGTSAVEDAPVVGGLLGGDDGLVESIGEDIVEPVLDTVEDLIETVGDDVLEPVLDTVSDVVDDVTDTVEDVVDTVVDGVIEPILDDVVGPILGDNDNDSDSVGGTKTIKHVHVVDNGDNGATPVGGVRAGALPHTGASSLPLVLLAGGAAAAAAGAGIRRFAIKAGK